MDLLSLMLKLQEKLVELITVRKARSRALLDDHYRPIFEDLISVHRGYLHALNELRSALSSRPTQEELVRLLSKNRASLAPVRANLLTLTQLFEEAARGSLDDDERDFVREVHLYLTSYFGGRTAFTGLLQLLDDLQAEAAAEQVIQYNLRRPHLGLDSLEGYFGQGLGRIERWLETQFSETALCYNRLRHRLLAASAR
jgi:hypothetical protein